LLVISTDSETRELQSMSFLCA